MGGSARVPAEEMRGCESRRFSFARQVELADGGLSRAISAFSPLVSAHADDDDRIDMAEIRRSAEGNANN